VNAFLLGTLFGLWGQASALPAVLTLPVAVWEFSLGVYFVVKGFRPAPITTDPTSGADPVRPDAGAAR